MKIVQIEREMSHTLAPGGFENIKPSVRLVATVAEGESITTAYEELNAALVQLWNQAALQELRIVAMTRKPNTLVKDDKLAELMAHFKSATGV